MKTYIYTTRFSKALYGQNVYIKVYRIKNNIPIFIGEHTYNTSSMKGHISEAFGVLYKNKEISKAMYNMSKGNMCGGGYYWPGMCDKNGKSIQIQIIGI